MPSQDDAIVLIDGARTPFGRFGGALSSLSAQQLGARAIAGALGRAAIDPARVDQVIVGQVLTAGGGQLTARVAATEAGIPMGTPALNINRMCLSGVDAIMLAQQTIATGQADVIVAAGQESMSNAPHLLPGSRRGFRYGTAPLIDHLEFDGLQDAFTEQSMGALTESRNAEYGVLREQQDAYAVESHRRAAQAAAAGLFDGEIVPVTISGRGGDQVVDADEGIRADVTAEGLAGLRPAFAPDGSLTAGNSSPISDGAAAVVVARRSVAEKLGVPWLAELGAGAVVAGPDSGLHEQPANAIAKACSRENLAVGDVDLVEINEAFAAVVLASRDRLGLDQDQLNVNGGAIALGHPIGTSGARISLHLARELGRRGASRGVVALCGGGGQGQALVLRAAS
ncbi:acetyl-CoA acetyltransferase [Aeromicrobium sp. PE09-221]|uniref:acetyl-CoA C-acetyltransferase n=1 Tax=Aeromicrobium sp. PE09-221 TaxID=1898043 RepID=UPI000B3E4EF4|nr:acetyl-CoA C-acetyltransferase [Aeromicrobium sp. PE09-221]OUZ09694.1 acetyl-CoA acetyltransferase [Aeromicrobium sp. PE09-221]